MPLATTCLTMKGEEITVAEALELREADSPLYHVGFRCTECNEFVKPHKAGGDAAAHFEHFENNPECSLSHKAR